MVTIKADDKKGVEVVLEADYCLVSVGRVPYTDKLGLDKAGVKMDDRGRVEVNGHLQTNVPNIYAIGDVVKGAMLAHKAEEEGTYVAEFINGEKPHIDYNLIVNTIGIVGLTLYLSIFYFIYKKRMRLKTRRFKNKTFRELDSIFYVLFFTQFITSFGGQMYAFTFRMIIFLYLKLFRNWMKY